MRSPKTTGLDAPGPGKVVFQARCSFWLHVTGRPVDAPIPIPLGPRKHGQSASPAVAGAATKCKPLDAALEVAACVLAATDGDSSALPFAGTGDAPASFASSEFGIISIDSG